MQAILLCNITTCCGYNTRNCNDSASCIPIFNFNRTFTVWTRMFRKGSPNPMGGLWEVAWSPAQYSSETEVWGGDRAWGLTLWMGRYIYGCIISQAIACSEKYRKKGSVERPLGAFHQILQILLSTFFFCFLSVVTWEISPHHMLPRMLFHFISGPQIVECNDPDLRLGTWVNGNFFFRWTFKDLLS